MNAHEFAAYTDVGLIASLTDEFHFQDMPDVTRKGARDYLVNISGAEADKPWEHQGEEYMSNHEAAANKSKETLIVH